VKRNIPQKAQAQAHQTKHKIREFDFEAFRAHDPNTARNEPPVAGSKTLSVVLVERESERGAVRGLF
jgi:hypothetical protein